MSMRSDDTTRAIDRAAQNSTAFGRIASAANTFTQGMRAARTARGVTKRSPAAALSAGLSLTRSSGGTNLRRR